MMKWIILLIWIFYFNYTESCIPCRCYVGAIDCTNVQSITSLTSLCRSMTFNERYKLEFMILFNSSINDIHLLSSCFPSIMNIDMRYVECPILFPHHHHHHQKVLSNCNVCISHSYT